MRRLVGAASIVLITLVLAPTASAQSGGFGGGLEVEDFDDTVESTAVQLVSAYGDPVQGAERLHDSRPGESVVAVTWPPDWNDARCSKAVPPENTGAFTYEGVCLAVWVCGGERIDELVSGEIAGAASDGRYASFLDEKIGDFGGDGAGEFGLGDAASINDFILAQGLGAAQDEQALPVFYWCGEQSVYDDTVVLIMSDSDPTLAPHFGWDTSIAAEYDLDALRNDALTELRGLLGFYRPEINAVPPTETGVTLVNWPTWFWVSAPEAPPAVYSANSSDTFRLEMRARFKRTSASMEGCFAVARLTT